MGASATTLRDGIIQASSATEVDSLKSDIGNRHGLDQTPAE